jgi:hypothetical protein
MAWPKGKPRPPGAGRQPGSPNKAETIRNVTMAAFTELGGKAYLVEVGRQNPAVFIHLLAKILPHELATSGGALKAEVLLRWMTPSMAAARGFLEAPEETEENEEIETPPPGSD